MLRRQRHEPRSCLLRRHTGIETKRSCRSGSLLHRVQTSAPERSPSKVTRTGLFLLMACQSHSKWKTLKPLSSTCASTASPSSSDRLKQKFAVGRRFAIPTRIASSFTRESESHSGIRGLRSCHSLVELDHLIFLIEQSVRFFHKMAT